MLALRVGRKVSAQTRRELLEALQSIPELTGRSIRISVRPQLTASRGKLLSGRLETGTAVHAAAFIRRRQIVLEEALHSRQLRLIFIHELFHFVWARLGNDLRRAFTALVEREWSAGARGELGESADAKKDKLRLKGWEELSPRVWREYVYESFCDTAAWLYSAPSKSSRFGLAARWSARRRRWFLRTFNTPRAC